MKTRQLPFFVYGTLQTGFKNNKAIVRGRQTSTRKARLPNATVYHFATEGCPGMYTGQSSAFVYGELFTFNPHLYDQVVQDLDILEEYFGPGDSRNEYERVVVKVAVSKRSDGAFCDTQEEEIEYVEAYAYFSLQDPTTVGGKLVESGDWRQYLLETGQEDAQDDLARDIVQGLVLVDAMRKPLGVGVSAS